MPRTGMAAATITLALAAAAATGAETTLSIARAPRTSPPRLSARRSATTLRTTQTASATCIRTRAQTGAPSTARAWRAAAPPTPTSRRRWHARTTACAPTRPNSPRSRAERAPMESQRTRSCAATSRRRGPLLHGRLAQVRGWGLTRPTTSGRATATRLTTSTKRPLLPGTSASRLSTTTTSHSATAPTRTWPPLSRTPSATPTSARSAPWMRPTVPWDASSSRSPSSARSSTLTRPTSSCLVGSRPGPAHAARSCPATARRRRTASVGSRPMASTANPPATQ
mmetsp:Transcript_22235/g.53245  ORF Transcript_22235/g.53245 Transcript_22235/m.53245 type:complete len:283 (+) Transcript_22235:22-870(+)